MEMLYGAIDIHKHVFQAAVFDPASGEVAEDRFPATREQLAAWAEQWHGRLCSVAIEATSGWRWVVRELQQRGFVVQLADPGQAVALKGKRRQAKTDRLDARWLAMLLAKQMLPASWIPPEEIQRLRDLTRLRLALSQDWTRWAQRLHAFLGHEGWPCTRSRLLTAKGRFRGTLDAHPARPEEPPERARLPDAEQCGEEQTKRITPFSAVTIPIVAQHAGQIGGRSSASVLGFRDLPRPG